MIRAFPKTGFVGLSLGLNLVDDLSIMKPGQAQKLDDMVYTQGTLKRRDALIDYIPFTTNVEIADAIEYVDINDQKHIMCAKKSGSDGIPSIFEIKNGEIVAHALNLTKNLFGFFAQMLGAAFFQNGTDPPLRIDTDPNSGDITTRIAGAPDVVNGVTTDISGSGNVDAGSHGYIVTACVIENGVLTLESDHSLTSTIISTGSQITIAWDASTDARVNTYRVYRNKANLGDPFYIVAQGNALSYVDNAADVQLTGQLAAPLGQNNPMPRAAIIVQSGRRLVCGNLTDPSDPLASKSVHISIIGINRYAAENFPIDGMSRFYLPTPGKITALSAFGSKDNDPANADLFVAQENHCYLVSNTDPTVGPTLISAVYGVVGKKAVTQWGSYLFFVSKQGLIFLDGSLNPKLISSQVNPMFLGGGPLNISPANGYEYITLSVYKNRLLICMRDDTGKIWGNKTLVLDLERFLTPTTAYLGSQLSAYFTVWRGDGIGWSFFLPKSNGDLLLFDNQNQRVLYTQLAPNPGFQDSVGGILKLIPVHVWTFGIMATQPEVLKALHQVNLLYQSSEESLMSVEADYGQLIDKNIVVAPSTTPIDWDKPWDKLWVRNSVNFTSIFVARGIKGRLFQLKLTVQNKGYEFVFVGMSLQYSAVMARRMLAR